MTGNTALGCTIAQTHAQDQKGSIPYRPQYTRITGKVAASILLQQISYWWHIKKGKPFYKFRAPCAHDWYKEGDSWTEELVKAQLLADQHPSMVHLTWANFDERTRNDTLTFWRDPNGVSRSASGYWFGTVEGWRAANRMAREARF